MENIIENRENVQKLTEIIAQFVGFTAKKLPNDVINKLDTERPIQIVLNCKGSMSSLVRELKPELDKENTRQGISLVVVGGS